ncbi:MAG: Eco57I restriction-modification methylase domain-containing protein [Oscillospiraceae bacterium]|nr:Eco57I restriction-modification methylase domain-containing protein [Oscillospiraceae bacterium]
MMKARQYNRRIFSPENQPNLANFADVMGVDTSMLKGSIRLFTEQFTYADTYGSLMTVTAPKDIDEAVSNFIPVFGITQRQLDMMMKIYNILGQKYDVVCTNPPYMGGSGMNARLSDYVKTNFPDSKSDLFACFIEKCAQLAKPKGFYAMITQHAWMFLSSYENLRVKLMHKTTVNMAHLGARAFDEIGGEVVQTTAFVMSGHIKDYKGTYVRLVDTVGENEKCELFLSGDKRFAAKQDNFSKIPGMPVAYWVSEAFVKAFENGKLLGDLIPVKKGMDTGNNDYFLKLWYEVHNFVSDYCEGKKKWIPYDKGGNFRKWYGNNEYILKWGENGFELENSKANLRSKHLYFKESITWNALSSADTCFRFSSYNGAFDSAGSSMFPSTKDMFFYIGIMNSNTIKHFLSKESMRRLTGLQNKYE